MTFSTMWPLAFLIAVPVIIIIYMLRPKGKKMMVPSLMLWKNAEVNSSSMSFVKKLLKNILMILEIIAAILLILALMSPFIRTGLGKHSVSTLLVIDTSGSMKHKEMNGSDKTRFDSAVSEMLDYAASSDGNISVLTVSDSASIVVANSTDKLRNRKAISSIECTDAEGIISDARGVIESLEVDNIIIYTDGSGAAGLGTIAEDLGAEVRVIGAPIGNAAILSVSAAVSDAGMYDIAADVFQYGGETSAIDVSFYDAADNLLSVRSITLDQNTGRTVIIKGVKAEGGYVRAELSGMQEDSIQEDNTSYAILNSRTSVPAYLTGHGNTYLEKAYSAASGQELIKIEDINALGDADKGIVFSETGRENFLDSGCMIINDKETAAGTIEGGYIRSSESDLTRGLASFAFGAGDVSYYDCPDWATEFLTLDDKCVGYYGINNNHREIVLGFDIRNTEFPLMAEFPVFIANSIDFLSDNSFVNAPYITAGDELMISPTAGDDATVKYISRDNKNELSLKSEAEYSGLIEVSADGRKEYISVRFPAAESDGTVTTASVAGAVDKSSVSMSSLRRILLVVVLILLIVDWIIFVRRNRKFNRLQLAVRILLTLLVFLSIIGVHLPGRRNKTATIFVVDMSHSVAELRPQMEDYLRDKLKNIPPRNEYGILTFGRDTMSEQFLTDMPGFLDLGTNPDGTATDIESAVRNAAAMIPDSYSGRIVILTDGQETLGDIAKTRELLDGAGIELDSVIFETEEKNDVYISSAEMPERLYPGDRYSLVVNVYSSYEVDAKISVRQGSVDKATSEVHLKPGSNTFLFSIIAGDKPIEENDIVVYAEGDQVAENDSYSVASSVSMSPKVLLVSGLTQDSSGLEALLQEINQDVTVVSVINMPDTLEKMLTYKTIILDNCYKPDMPEGFLNNLETYVKDYSGGLIVCGGDESFAPGGYRGTPLETVLPVDMTPKGITEAPSMAMVMVMDNSGSMSSEINYNSMTGQADGRSKLAIAIAAAIGAIDNLMDEDYVGVLTFDDSYEWVQKVEQVGKVREEAIEAVRNIPVGGGTSIQPALLEAIDQISEVDAGIKHILLLTDGQGETRDFSEAIAKANANGITVSTIAVGADSDGELLKDIADQCGGRYYFSSSASEVPRIFAEEVYMSGNTYYKEGEFGLAVRSGNELVKGLYDEGIPMITGYIAASAKPAATEIILSDEEDPILCCWQYGLGRTISWTSTASGSWNEDFVGLTQYAEMWRRMLDYTSYQQSSTGDYVRVDRAREKMLIQYTAGDFGEETEIEGVITSPEGETERIDFTSDSPGHYSASAAPSDPGVYNINVRRIENGEVVSSQNAIATVHFSDEYRFLSNDRYINYINDAGKILTVKDKVFGKIRVKKIGKKDITDFLIMAALLILMLDIIVRRFNLSMPQMKRRKKAAQSGGSTEAVVEPVNVQLVSAEPDNTEWQPVNSGTPSGMTMPQQGIPTGMNMGQPGMMPQPGAVPQPAGRAKKADKKAKKAAKNTAPAALDTSALLKKKQDRTDYKG